MFFQVETKLWRDDILVARENYYIQAPFKVDAEILAVHAAEDSPFWNPKDMMYATSEVDAVPVDSIPPGAPVIVSTLSENLPLSARDAGSIRPVFDTVAATRMDWEIDDGLYGHGDCPAVDQLQEHIAISDATGAIVAMESHIDVFGLLRNERPTSLQAASRFGVEFSGVFMLAAAADDVGPTSREILETLGGHTAVSIRVVGELDDPAISYEILDHHGRKVAHASFERTLAASEMLGCPNVAYTTLATYSETMTGLARTGEIPAMAFSLLATFQVEHDIRRIQASLDGAGIHAHLSVSMDFAGDGNGRHEGVQTAAYARVKNMMAGWEDWFPSTSGRLVPERLVLGRRETLYLADLPYDVDSETHG